MIGVEERVISSSFVNPDACAAFVNKTESTVDADIAMKTLRRFMSCLQFRTVLPIASIWSTACLGRDFPFGIA
jgi:hypothetical protein